ncbi:MAG: hypothetical protein V8T16_01815 [Parabacteroides merdae]
MFMKIPGEGLDGVYSANEYLTRLNLMKAYDPEYDTPITRECCRYPLAAVTWQWTPAVGQSVWVPQHVYVVYRRGMEELPARKEEVEHAIEEEIEFKTLCNPVAVIEDEKNPGHVGAIRCIKMELGEPDASGRRSPRLSPAANSTCLLTPSSCPWAPAPTP